MYSSLQVRAKCDSSIGKNDTVVLRVEDKDNYSISLVTFVLTVTLTSFKEFKWTVTLISAFDQ